jgi:hypothetical protein
MSADYLTANWRCRQYRALEATKRLPRSRSRPTVSLGVCLIYPTAQLTVRCPVKSRAVEVGGTQIECRASSLPSHAGLRVRVSFFDNARALGKLVRICFDPCTEHAGLARLDVESLEAEALSTLSIADIAQAIESCKAMQHAGRGVDYPCTLLRSWHFALPSCRIDRARFAGHRAST